MSSPNSCVVVCVNVLGWGQVDVRSTQNSCVIVCVNVLGWGQMEVSRGENISCFSWLSFILSIVPSRAVLIPQNQDLLDCDSLKSCGL